MGWTQYVFDIEGLDDLHVHGISINSDNNTYII